MILKLPSVKNLIYVVGYTVLIILDWYLADKIINGVNASIFALMNVIWFFLLPELGKGYSNNLTEFDFRSNSSKMKEELYQQDLLIENTKYELLRKIQNREIDAGSASKVITEMIKFLEEKPLELPEKLDYVDN